MEEDQMDPGLIIVTLTQSGFGGFPGLPPDLQLPEGFLPPEGGEGDGDGDGEIPGDLPFPEGFPPEGFPPLDGLPLPEDIEPPEPVEVELIIDGFIVTGSRDARVMIQGEEMGDGMPAMEGEVPIKPVEEE